MSLILSGTDGLSDVDGSAATPAIRGTDANTGIFFPAADTIAFSEGGVEAMRIDSSGNVGIGTASPSTFPAKFAVSGAVASGGQNYSAGFSDAVNSTFRIGHQSGLANLITDTAMAFYTSSTERMRIDSSGNLLVGTTNTSATAGAGMKFVISTDPSNPPIRNVLADASGAIATYTLYSTNAAAYRFYVTSAGTVNATTTTITAISDQRLKENIRDLDDGLEKVLALKPRKFDWKENKGENIKNARGFIAQELELVFPDMISNWIDEPPEGEEPYKAVNANLIPTLVKAIQELKALVDTQSSTIQSLTARITALETPAEPTVTPTEQTTPSTGTQA